MITRLQESFSQATVGASMSSMGSKGNVIFVILIYLIWITYILSRRSMDPKKKRAVPEFSVDLSL